MCLEHCEVEHLGACFVQNQNLRDFVSDAEDGVVRHPDARISMFVAWAKAAHHASHFSRTVKFLTQ